MSDVGDCSGQYSCDSLVCNVNLTVPASLACGCVFSILGGVWSGLVCLQLCCMLMFVPELFFGMCHDVCGCLLPGMCCIVVWVQLYLELPAVP